MFGLGGKVALGALLAILLTVGLGSGLNAFVPNNSSRTTQTITVSSSPSTWNDCSGGLYHGTTWMIVYSLTDGSIQTLGSPCGGAVFQNGMGALDVTSSPMLPIILANGWVNAFYVNLQTQQIAQIPGVTFSSNYSQAFYNGQPIINGTRLPTPYTSPSTTIRNIPTCAWLNGDIVHVAYPPVASGPIFLKMVTDQGSVVTNGTVYASQRSSLTDWRGSADYCLALSYDTNSTGYMQVGDSADVIDGGNGLSLYAGVYNYTVIADYGVNQTSRVIIPDIVVQPNATLYITISIPSDQVTTVTCGQGNSCTTTTVTSSSKGS